LASPCSSRGVCKALNDEDQTYTCTCMTGYTGRNCETVINSNIAPLNGCASYRCQNGGSCFTNIDGQPFCRCILGYIGKYCSNCMLLVSILDNFRKNQSIKIVFKLLDRALLRLVKMAPLAHQPTQDSIVYVQVSSNQKMLIIKIIQRLMVVSAIKIFV
jgi:hypothetical protein